MQRQLDKIFKPKSIAIIGASTKTNTVGSSIINNILKSEYQGKVYPINLKYDKILGQKVFRRIKHLPEIPDLAIIATPVKTVPEILKECGEFGINGVSIISAGFQSEGNLILSRIKAIARTYQINILGPNSLGFINPGIQLNASLTNQMARKGRIAFISESGALCISILDWSLEQKFGFSHFVSTGSMINIGYHDLIDYLGSQIQTACILVYMESLSNARAFMSAAKAFARSKPIIVLKAGQSIEGAKAALSHTGALLGNDQAFEAAFKRAGIIRVNTVAQLFNVAQAFAMQPRPLGNRLAIVSNAGGPGILATDHLIKNGGKLPELPPEIMNKLKKVLPNSWSKKKPLDLLEQTTPNQYVEAIEACLNNRDTNGVLAIFTPERSSDAVDVANALVKIKSKYSKTLLACWMGEEEARKGRAILEEHNIPTYRFPESAVDVFLKMYSYSKNIKLVYETPSNIPEHFSPNRAIVRSIIAKYQSQQQFKISERDSKQILSAYDITVNQGYIVHDVEELKAKANIIGYPVALKINTSQVIHKTEVQGVVLNIQNETTLLDQYHTLLAKVAFTKPDIEIDGVLIEKMHSKTYELLIGANKDVVFGPVILFGMGGIAVELFQDQNTAIPPLNMALAQQLIEGTKVFQLLEGYRGIPGVNKDALKFLLYKFSYLVMDFPEIESIDINPYAIDQEGGIVLDAAIILDKNKKLSTSIDYRHLVISPYPTQYIKKTTARDGSPILLRPIRPEDEPLEKQFFDYLSKETIYFRFFGYISQLSKNMLTRFTHIDYDREMAIVAEIEKEGHQQLVGVVRIVGDPWGEKAEYAIVIADAWQNQGLGGQMTDFILEIAQDKGYQVVYGTLLKRNTGMKKLFERKGFTVRSESFDTYYAELKLPPKED